MLATTGTSDHLHFTGGNFHYDAPGHAADNLVIEHAKDNRMFAAYGGVNDIEIWDSADRQLKYSIDINHQEPVQLRFTSADEVTYATRGGQIFSWTPSGGSRVVARLDKPISHFLPLSDGRLIVESDDGILELLTSGQPPTVVRQLHEHEHLMTVSTDQAWLVTGNDDGEVTVYDTSVWQVVLSHQITGPVHHVAISTTTALLAIATKSGDVYIGRLSLKEGRIDWPGVTWNQFTTHPRFLAFTPSGDLLIVTTGDGAIWFYSPLSQRWLYFFGGIAGFTVARPASDGRHCATVDSSGRLLIIDLDLVRQHLSAFTDGHY